MTDKVKEEALEDVNSSSQPDIKQEPETEPGEKPMTTAGRSGKRPGKRGRKPSKVDVKVKLERSRQSARECRARKKLRYQYLEELVSSRERAIFALREELEQVREWCVKIDSGQIPKEAVTSLERHTAKQKQEASSSDGQGKKLKKPLKSEEPQSPSVGNRRSKSRPISDTTTKSMTSPSESVPGAHVMLPPGICLSAEEKKQLQGSLLNYLGTSSTDHDRRSILRTTRAKPAPSATVTTATMVWNSSDDECSVVSSENSVPLSSASGDAYTTSSKVASLASKDRTELLLGSMGSVAGRWEQSETDNNRPSVSCIDCDTILNSVDNSSTAYQTDAAYTVAGESGEQFQTIDFSDLGVLPINDVIKRYLSYE